MADLVRQSIDIASLSTYLRENVPRIRLPVQIKQVYDLGMMVFPY